MAGGGTGNGAQRHCVGHLPQSQVGNNSVSVMRNRVATGDTKSLLHKHR